MTGNRRAVVVAAFVVVGLVTAAAVGLLRLRTGDSGPAATVVAARGDAEPAPDVTFAMADGSDAALADYRGRPVVLNFWASWCPPCVAEMGDALGPVHREHGDAVTFLGMNLQDEPEAAQRILDQTGVTYDLAVDPTGEIFAAFEGVGMPTTVFIDSDGRIVDKHTGVITREQLEERVAALRGA